MRDRDTLERVVAAGRMDATWTLFPKNEWDLAGPAALLGAANALAVLPDGSHRTWNSANTRLPGFVAAREPLADEVHSLVSSVV